MTDQNIELAPLPVPTESRPQGVPSALERSEIPLYFRQFKNPAVLKKLAHAGKGPLYQLIGKTAWYETADIIAWLGSRKRTGPERTRDGEKASAPSSLQVRTATGKKRRGRPTKATLWRRKEQARRSES
jgi:hypothetical protein